MTVSSLQGKILGVVGSLCIVVGIMCNEWILAALFSPDGILSLRNRIIIWIFDLTSIILGIFILYIRRRITLNFELVRNLYKAMALLTFNTIVLFIAANIGVYIVLSQRPTKPLHDFAYEAEEKFVKDKAFIHKVYENYSEKDISELMRTPNITAHPTLEFMEDPFEHYNVGLENMRYTKYVNGENAKDKINGSTWIFGGSTSDDETIAYYLNELDTSSVYINFAIQAYHQNLEIEKLLLLMKKGYRPQRVIFIDGLNDISAMKATNFHPAETPMRSYDAYGYLSNVEAFLEAVKRPGIGSIVRSAPLMDLLLSTIDEKGKNLTMSTIAGYDDIYDSQNLYHTDRCFITV